MEKPNRQAHSQLFTVRVWQEELGEGHSEWRGSVKNIASGEERYFRTWPALGEVMQGMTGGLGVGSGESVALAQRAATTSE